MVIARVMIGYDHDYDEYKTAVTVAVIEHGLNLNIYSANRKFI